ncbi:MAG: GntR family transcriptional regulator [Lachnospiraceae bacterium]|nr:GntR family transcriptional regulator [Lachnospiraceae bacterium]
MAWNFDGSTPIYLQIVNILKGEIAGGAYPPGSRLPSVRDLALEAGVNPNTMQRALAELERTGLVNAQRTAGRFITEDAPQLTQLRYSMSEQIISELVERLRALGLSDEQIPDAVRAWIERDHSGQS